MALRTIFAKSWELTFPRGMPVSPSGLESITLQRSRSRTTSKRKEKRRVKAMIAKLREGKKTRKEIQQEVNSWLGFARWASAYNLAKKMSAQ